MLQDSPRIATAKVEEINLAPSGEMPRLTFIAKETSLEERINLVTLLQEYMDVFACTYDQMLGLDMSLATHKLNINPSHRLVKEAPRVFCHKLELQIKVEVENLLKVGFIRPIKNPKWLANVVPVKRKNGQIRICIYFRDLNKAYPKDEFPLPNVDTLIDATAAHQRFSFMDYFSGYNQIKMHRDDT